MNVRLFDRSKTGMSLTNEGVKLYNKVKSAVLVLETAENIFRKRGKIRVGTRVAMFSRLLGLSISKFFKFYPEINHEVKYLVWEEIIQQLNEQKIDVGIYRECTKIENTNIKFIKLGELENIFFTNSEKDIVAISKEFIKKELTDGIFKIINTDFKLPKVTFGLYFNKDNKFDELDKFIKMLKDKFLN